MASHSTSSPGGNLQIHLEDSLTQHARDVLVGAAHALELIEEAATITLPDRRFVYVNSVFERLYGFSCATMLGRSNLPIHTPAVSDQLIETIFKTTAEGGWQGELQNQTRRHKRFEIRLRTRPLKTASGETVGYLGICHPSHWQRVPEDAVPEVSPATPASPALQVLSTREREVLSCYGNGMNTKQIAEYLCISCPSVFTYRSRVIQKMHIQSPADFYVLASCCAKLAS
jgi:PAS domain S-box-containing protein